MSELSSDYTKWSSQYVIGIDRIDFEHKIFLDLIGDFHQEILSKSDKSNLEATLNEIILYAKFHFCSEENMMARMGYPGLAAHQEIHYHLIDILNNKMVALSMGAIEPIDVLSFLVDWFVKHTTLEDVKIAAFRQSSMK